MTFSGHTHLLFWTYQDYIGCLGWYALYYRKVPGHTHFLDISRAILGAFGMHCMIVTFPGHAHLLFEYVKGYIRCLVLYALYDNDAYLKLIIKSHSNPAICI